MELQSEILQVIGGTARIHEDVFLNLISIFNKIPHDNTHKLEIWNWLNDIQLNNVWNQTKFKNKEL